MPTRINRNQERITIHLQRLMLSYLESHVHISVHKLYDYLNLIQQSMRVLNKVDDELLASERLGKIVSEILNTEVNSVIDDARFQKALDAISKYKTDSSDDEANKASLAEAQASLVAAQDEVTKLEAELADLQAGAADDEANKAALAETQAKLDEANKAVVKAEDEANQLIDQLVPAEVAPTEPTV